jgi:hypothetical protein
MKIMTFESIKIFPSLKDIFRLLGYSLEKTTITDGQKKDIERYIDEALTYIDIKARAFPLRVVDINNDVIHLEQGIVLKSENLAFFLKGAYQVLLMGATAGSAIMDKIEALSQDEDLAKAVVYNATASQCADQALDWMGSYLNQSFRRENLILDARRFSAGYGDFSISYQQTLWEILSLNEIGIAINDNFVLIPEKSVTALSPIRKVDDEANA